MSTPTVVLITMIISVVGTVVSIGIIQASRDEERVCGEDLAQALHEAGREAVEQGQTVAATLHGEKAQKFLEWDDVPAHVRNGRRMQARWLLKYYTITEKRLQ